MILCRIVLFLLFLILAFVLLPSVALGPALNGVRSC